jgi:phage tail sheath protein FI
VAYALGLRALIDNEQGWHKSLSNVPVKNVLGIAKDVFWALQAEDSDANELNANEITTLIKRDGFRFWGNRTRHRRIYFRGVHPNRADSGGQYRRSAVHHRGYPADPGERERRGERINAKLQALVTAGKLIGAACWFDIVDNPTTGMRQGKAVVRYNYSPVPPLEDLTMIQTFTDQYYEPLLHRWEVNSGYS